MTSERTKTSLLVIATIFTGFGAAAFQTSIVNGSVLLLIAVGVLVLRGYLKQQGIIRDQESKE